MQRFEEPAPGPPAKTSRGVTGALVDMGMTDIIQVLFHGRKTAALRVEWSEHQGELHFSEGRIVDAFVSEITGENAVYAMLGLGEDGTFSVDPDFVPTDEPTIYSSPEALLLEGMRLLDEGLTPDPGGKE